jgi:hypothetical protein
MSTDEKLKENTRGIAQSLLVIPSQLLTAEGQLTFMLGIVILTVEIIGLVPGVEEMALGVVAMFWGGLVIHGAKHMHEVTSYKWAMIGSVLGLLPILVGIFGLIALQNPQVKASFAEVEAEGGRSEEERQIDGWAERIKPS